MKLDKKDLDHVIKLAHLHIDPSEKERYLSDMQHTLELMTQLDGLDLDNVAPSAYSFDDAHTLREDIPIKKEDYFLEKNAPEWVDGCFKVPKILGDA